MACFLHNAQANGRNAQDGTSRGLRGIRGARRPGGVQRLRRQSCRRGRVSGEDHGPLAGGRGLPGPGPRGARAGPRLRGRAPGRRRRHVPGAVPDDEGPVHQPEPGREAAAAAGPRRAEAAAAPDAAAAPGGPGAPPLAGRPAALQGPRRQRDLAPLRRVQPVLRVGARADHGLHLRLLPARGRDPGGGTGSQVRPGGAQAGAAAGHAAARRGLRLGRHGDARRAGVRRQGARRHAVRAAGRLGPGRDRAGGPVRAGRGAAPGLPGRARDGLRRGQLHRPHRAHRQGRTSPATSRSCSAS